MRTALRVLALVGAIGMVLAVGITPAAAHTRLVATTPKADATVTEELKAVVLRFNEPVNQAVGKVEVRAPDGTAVEDGALNVDGERVRQPLGSLPVTGRYTVAYRVVAADGHPLTGEFHFAYDGPVPGAEAEPAPEPSAMPSMPESEAAEMHSEPGQHETEAAGQAGSGQEGGSQQAAVAGSGTPWPLLASTAAVLLGFVVASIYAVRAFGRRQHDTGP